MASDLVMAAIHDKDLLSVKKIYEMETREDNMFSLDSINREERMTPLCLAARLGNKEIVEFLLQAGAKPNIACTCVHRNKAALHFACEHCHADSAQIVQLLINAGANVEQETFDFEKALHFACEFNNLPVVECLVLSAADVNCVNLDGKSPLSLACSRKKHPRTLSIIKFLIDNGADLNNSDGMQNINPVRLLIQNKNIEGVQYLIDKGLLPKDEDFLTDAVLTSYPEMVKVLIDQQFKINESTSLFQLTALHQACMSPVVSPEIVEILLIHGANSDVQSKLKDTPLHYACQKGNVQKVVLLLKYGANINYSNKHGFTPLDACFVKSCCTSDKKLLIMNCFVLAGMKIDTALQQKMSRFKDHIDPVEFALIDSQLTSYLRTPMSLLNICRISIRHRIKLHNQKIQDMLSQELPSAVCEFLQFSDLLSFCEEDKA